MESSSKPAKRVGRKLNIFHGINRRDFAVMFILWSSELFDPWMSDWDETSLPNFFDSPQMLESTYFKVNLALVFIFKCSLCLALSIASDLHDRKYFGYIICLFVYFSTPITSLIIYSLQSIDSVVIIPWGLSFMFICHPVQLCSIFSQSVSASRKQIRLLSALFILTACISIYVASLTFAVSFHTIRHRMGVVTWIVIALAFLVLIPITIYLKQYVRPEVIAEKSIKRLYIGIREDVKNDFKNNDGVCRIPKSTLKVIIFLALLIPILLSNVVHTYIFQIDGNSLSPNINPTTLNAVLFWQIVAIPIAEIILLVLHSVSERIAGVLNLGLPLLINLAAVLLIYAHINCHRKVVHEPTWERGILIDERDAMEQSVGPLPATRSELYEFYNMLNKTVYLSSADLKFQIKPRERYAARIANNVYEFQVEWTVEGYHQKYISKARGNLDEISSFIIEDFSNGTRFLEVSGHQWVRPGRTPVLVFMCTFESSTNSSNRWIHVRDERSTFSRTFLFPESAKSIHFHAPASSLEIKFNEGEFVNRRYPDAFEKLRTKPYSVYTLIVDKNYANVVDIHAYLIMQLRVPRSQKWATHRFSVPYQGARSITIAFGLHGASLGLMQVGYIYHFWTEAPIRLRTTVIAAFLVVEALVDRLLCPHLGHFHKRESIAILVVQIFSTCWHFVLATIYYFLFFTSRKTSVPTSVPDITEVSDSKSYSKLDYFGGKPAFLSALSVTSDPTPRASAVNPLEPSKEGVAEPSTSNVPQSRGSRTSGPNILPETRSTSVAEEKPTDLDTRKRSKVSLSNPEQQSQISEGQN